MYFLTIIFKQKVPKEKQELLKSDLIQLGCECGWSETRKVEDYDYGTYEYHTALLITSPVYNYDDIYKVIKNNVNIFFDYWDNEYETQLGN